MEGKAKERMVITVYKDYYEQNYEVFRPPNTEVKSIFVEGEEHVKDEMHKSLLKTYMKAQKALRDYEFNKRHNK